MCCMRSPLFVCSPTAMAAVNRAETAPYRRRPRRRRAANGCVRAASVARPPVTSQQAEFFCRACSCSVRGVLHMRLIAGARLVCRGVVWFVFWGVSVRSPPNTPFPSSLYKPRTRAHAHASELGWTRMYQNGPEWGPELTRIDQYGRERTRAGQSRPKQTRADQSEPERTSRRRLGEVPRQTSPTAPTAVHIFSDDAATYHVPHRRRVFSCAARYVASRHMHAKVASFQPPAGCAWT